MLLGAEWRPHMMCFVKQHKHEPSESDGFVWPAPTFEFFDREGRPIEGPRKQSLMKVANPQVKFNIPDFRHSKSVFSPGPIRTATEVRHKMEAAISRASADMAKQMDDHLMDAMMYGMGVMKIDPPKPSFDSITINNRHDLKVLRPGLGVYKIPDA